MQLKQAVDSAYQLFIENDVPSPRLNAELLLLFVLNRERSYLYAHPERELNADEQSRYDEVIQERARGCPTQYITGHQEFWGLDLLVSPAVLIPRPETEHVVETVLELLKEHPLEGLGKLKLLDVGTGSGCIALALASELPLAEIHACDISDEALEMARTNAARLGLSNKVVFRKSDLLPVTPANNSTTSSPIRRMSVKPTPTKCRSRYESSSQRLLSSLVVKGWKSIDA